MGKKKGILERLAEGPIVGDGSMVVTLEKRGFVKAGPWTPESVVEYPDAVLQLHREYVRAGADVIQTASFYASDDKLCYGLDKDKAVHTSSEINDAACKLARRAADEGDCLVCGGISPVPCFGRGEDESVVRREFTKQLAVFKKHDVDFVMAEFFHNVREIEICASEMKKQDKPFALCMRIGMMGDQEGISVEECAVRMAKTGASIVGVNCAYDKNTHLKVMKRMKDALDKKGLTPYLICQPLGFCCPEVEDNPMGYLSLPEFPLAMDPRILTRIEAHQFARAAYDMGINYIGGCCGFEPHHIRAISQELEKERGKAPPGNDMTQAFGGPLLATSLVNSMKNMTTREYWYDLKAGSGRPFNPALSKTNSTEFVYDSDKS